MHGEHSVFSFLLSQAWVHSSVSPLLHPWWYFFCEYLGTVLPGPNATARSFADDVAFLPTPRWSRIQAWGYVSVNNDTGISFSSWVTFPRWLIVFLILFTIGFNDSAWMQILRHRYRLDWLIIFIKRGIFSSFERSDEASSLVIFVITEAIPFYISLH